MFHLFILSRTVFKASLYSVLKISSSSSKLSCSMMLSFIPRYRSTILYSSIYSGGKSIYIAGETLTCSLYGIHLNHIYSRTLHKRLKIFISMTYPILLISKPLRYTFGVFPSLFIAGLTTEIDILYG